MKTSRFMMAATAVTAAALVLTGCGTSASSEKLSLWMPPFASGSTSDQAEWDKIVAGFEQKNDVDVEVSIIPWETFADKLLAGFSGGQGPDVVYMYNELIGDYLQQGALAPLDLTGVDTSDYMYLDNGLIDGKQYSMPFMVGGARVLYYNKDLLAQAGVDEAPTTWDDFVDASEKLVDAGITPLVQSWGDPAGGVLNDTFYEFLWQAGGDVLTEDGSAAAWDSPEGLKAAQFLLELKEKKILSDSALSTTTDQAIDQFASGNAAFFVQVDAEASTFDDAGINWGWIDSLQGERKGTFVATDSLVMSSGCSDQRLCQDLIVYLTSADQMKQFHSWTDHGPINHSEESDSQFAALYQDSEILFSLPVAAGSPTGYNDLYTNLQQMLLGQKTPEQALKDSAAAANAALERAQQK